MLCKHELSISPRSQERALLASLGLEYTNYLTAKAERGRVCVCLCVCSCSVCNEDALVCFLSAELHVFSGTEVSDQSVNSHTAGPHHSLPCTGGSGNTHSHTRRQHVCTVADSCCWDQRARNQKLYVYVGNSSSHICVWEPEAAGFTSEYTNQMRKYWNVVRKECERANQSHKQGVNEV